MTPAEQAQYEVQGFNPNNQYGFLTEILVTGFEAGFFGGSGLPIPDAMGLTSGASRVDLDQMWNWSGLYAYGAVGPVGGPLAAFAYQNTVTAQHYDVYTKPIFQNTNAYGWSYSDFLSTFGGAVNPQVSLWDPQANSGAGGQVSQIDIMLSDLTDTPSGAYQKPTLDDYFLQPVSSPALVQSQTTGNNGFILNIDASFGIPTEKGGPTYTPIGPADGTPMALRIFEDTGTFSPSLCRRATRTTTTSPEVRAPGPTRRIPLRAASRATSSSTTCRSRRMGLAGTRSCWARDFRRKPTTFTRSRPAPAPRPSPSPTRPPTAGRSPPSYRAGPRVRRSTS
jgi:hypothetical protein